MQQTSSVPRNRRVQQTSSDPRNRRVQQTTSDPRNRQVQQTTSDPRNRQVQQTTSDLRDRQWLHSGIDFVCQSRLARSARRVGLACFVPKGCQCCPPTIEVPNVHHMANGNQTHAFYFGKNIRSSQICALTRWRKPGLKLKIRPRRAREASARPPPAPCSRRNRILRKNAFLYTVSHLQSCQELGPTSLASASVPLQ